MGQNIEKDSFTKDDETQFSLKLESQLQELNERLNQPGFSSGAPSLGAEVELYIVDNQGAPAPLNAELIQAVKSPLLTEELNRFNLEINLSPVLAGGKPFSLMQQELDTALSGLREEARARDARIATIGILPTLKPEHLQRHYMTDRPRYRALTNSLKASKGSAFFVDINGIDSLRMTSDEVTLEGANTSFQVHLKIPANRFADYYNAAQLITPLALAIAGNSPTFLNKRLWQETRIALFKQAIDDRHPVSRKWRRPARVCFGHGWVRHSAWELFAQNVSLYSPLIPHVFDSASGFGELCLHHGTVWSWNRAVFDPAKEGHLRIEFRALPSGPTLIDMMANAAFLTGLTQAFADKMTTLLPAIPFNYAEYNFYRAAKDGLDAQLLWPNANQHGVTESPVKEVIARHVKTASDGLKQLGVDSQEVDTLMSVIEQRLASEQTGAVWQLKRLESYNEGVDSEHAFHQMLEDYLLLSDSGVPVGEWPES